MIEIKEKIEHISAYGLRERREWTDALIEKFLGEPDKIVWGPKYRTTPRLKLYLLSRAIEIEDLPEFKDVFTGTRKRSEEEMDTDYIDVESFIINGREFVYPPSDVLGDGSGSGYNYRNINRRFFEEEDLEEDPEEWDDEDLDEDE